MNSASKRMRSCPAHPSRGARYRPQTLAHPEPFATSPFSFPTNPAHTDPLPKANQEPRQPQTASRQPALAALPPRPASSPQRHQGHDTTTLAYAKDVNPTPLRT